MSVRVATALLEKMVRGYSTSAKSVHPPTALLRFLSRAGRGWKDGRAEGEGTTERVEGGRTWQMCWGGCAGWLGWWLLEDGLCKVVARWSTLACGMLARIRPCALAPPLSCCYPGSRGCCGGRLRAPGLSGGVRKQAASSEGLAVMGAEREGAQVTEAIVEMGRRLEPEIVGYRRLFHENPGALEARVRHPAADLRGAGRAGRSLPQGGRHRRHRDRRRPGARSLWRRRAAGAARGAAGRHRRAAGDRAHGPSLRLEERWRHARLRPRLPYRHDAGERCACCCELRATIYAARCVVLFQPAEEVSLRRPQLMIDADGAIEGVDAIYGAHIWSEVDAGTVLVRAGAAHGPYRLVPHRHRGRLGPRLHAPQGGGRHRGGRRDGDGAAGAGEPRRVALRAGGGDRGGVPRRRGPQRHGRQRPTSRAPCAPGPTSLREEVPDRLERIVGKTAHAFNANCARSPSSTATRGSSNDPRVRRGLRGKPWWKVLGEGAVGSPTRGRLPAKTSAST